MIAVSSGPADPLLAFGPGARAAAATVAFHGGKGGVGTTFLASEVTALLAREAPRVAAVDLDLHRGALHYRLDVPLSRDTFTIRDLLPALDDLSDLVLDNALSHCPCGARLLPAPGGGDPGFTPSPDEMRALRAALSTSFAHVIVDTHPCLDPVTLDVLTGADLVFLVVTPELACLGGAKKALGTIGSCGADSARFRLVVNRSLGDDDAVNLSDFESYLGLPVSVVLPEETVRCRRAADEGRFVAGDRSPLGQGIQALARLIFGVPGAKETSRFIDRR
jgi:Flp pilus assembly CpaE family ATPase